MIIKLTKIVNSDGEIYLTYISKYKFETLFEFHINREIRNKYKVDDSLFTLSGNVIFPNFHAVRNLADKINKSRPVHEEKVRPGDLNAMGLIDEIYHYVVRLYEETANPKVFRKALQYINKEHEKTAVERCLLSFGEEFPPLAVYQNKITIRDYIRQNIADRSNTEILLEELMMLHFANFNPAFSPFKEMFNDSKLAKISIYNEIIKSLEIFFKKEKPFGPDNQHIFDLLRAPILAHPHSLKDQLTYIKKRWGLLLSDKYLKKILSADDLIKEDMRLIFPGPPTTPPVPRYTVESMKGIIDLDYERFTSDTDWMPNVVLLAKNIYVWMDQLSKFYQRPIKKLHEIPDEELDRLAKWNITALWLIGIWERSSASQKIKQWTGNPEAAASAYSLFDYTIANDLGGEESFNNLRYRAWQRGIRLASDMVPNHTGIFSKWIIEHPEYFIQSSYPPFPNYRYTGGNLSDHPDIQIRIEDGYWNRTDAAVAFQRIDNRTGEHRYIYHGNDGTHMPWNDTAQLNFLKPEVREAVIQTILHVARLFPIIRFDAAMTLTKRHYQRLWFPAPGTGGDIPSRADYALSTEEFNTHMPNEFWREVVDRINTEIPNTLLLAEAFWLLEGYFVRTLGMHRVYNSAFMHMLMKEENAKYRELIKNTLHYNPEILKRYVNFMSNPDEETAVAQFGKDDKYFGVAVLMVTLPGLPMFAHGQIEGYTEKYGMEYKRAYYNETPDTNLVRRHEEEIFPLLKQRKLFSQVNHFELYNLIDTHGNVNEDVIVYSNMQDGNRALICFHNAYKVTAGWIKHTAGRNVGSTDNPQIIYKNLGQGLEISTAENVFYTFRDQKTGLEYIRSAAELHERGIYVELKAFQYHIFINFREITDTSGDYEKLRRHLHGKGTYNIEEELHKVRLFPVYLKLADLISDSTLNVFSNFISSDETDENNIDSMLKPILSRYAVFQNILGTFLGINYDAQKSREMLRNKLISIRKKIKEFPTGDEQNARFIKFNDKENLLILYIYTIITCTQDTLKKDLYSYLRLYNAFEDIIVSVGIEVPGVRELNDTLRFLLSEEFATLRTSDSEYEIIGQIFEIPGIQSIIKCNFHQGINYFNKEKMENLLEWIYIQPILKDTAISQHEYKIRKEFFNKLYNAIVQSGYNFEEFKILISRIGVKRHA